jgi:putative photosynthetic complex assembly protein 2
MLSASPWVAGFAALFLWWFSTGAILCRVRLADRAGGDAHIWSVLLGLPVLGLGVWGLLATASDPSVTGAYAAFGASLLVWGWIELAFLSGQITGPNRSVLPPGRPEWERFLRACGTIAYHELALIGIVLLLMSQVWGSANHVGLWTFVVLFLARISAKLNLFYGVPKINTEFLPSTLRHLPSHFRHRRMNAVFPVSVIGLAAASWWWLARIADATGAGETVGYALLAAITLLALLEHLFMVLPLPDEKLWRWMLPAAPKPTQKTL